MRYRYQYNALFEIFTRYNPANCVSHNRRGGWLFVYSERTLSLSRWHWDLGNRGILYYISWLKAIARSECAAFSEVFGAIENSVKFGRFKIHANKIVPYVNKRLVQFENNFSSKSPNREFHRKVMHVTFHTLAAYILGGPLRYKAYVSTCVRARVCACVNIRWETGTTQIVYIQIGREIYWPVSRISRSHWTRGREKAVDPESDAHHFSICENRNDPISTISTRSRKSPKNSPPLANANQVATQTVCESDAKPIRVSKRASQRALCRYTLSLCASIGRPCYSFPTHHRRAILSCGITRWFFFRLRTQGHRLFFRVLRRFIRLLLLSSQISGVWLT